jgi:hypothetical protein
MTAIFQGGTQEERQSQNDTYYISKLLPKAHLGQKEEAPSLVSVPYADSSGP